MTNHPRRSRKLRTVTFKIMQGGAVARCLDATKSELAIHVTDVPGTVPDDAVAVQIRKVILLPTRGPWLVAWERLADADQGSILRNCTHPNA